VGIDLDNINSSFRLKGSSELFVFSGLFHARKRQEVRVVVYVVQLIELLIEFEDDPEDGGCLRKLVEDLESFGVKLQSLDHHLLGEDHHDQILESSANDHVSDGSADKLFEKPLLCLLVGEVAF
jgi:hypothetical protein